MSLKQDLAAVVISSLAAAKPVADELLLAEVKKAFLSEDYRARAMVQDLAPFRVLTLGSAKLVEAAVLFVDMRGSTSRAVAVGPHATYMTMHGLLPALAFLVENRNGYIVGFRGDGLFAIFGIDENGNRQGDISQAVKDASMCGHYMLEGTDSVVNPLLKKFGVPGDVQIGVGVDVGKMVITKIGLPNANEVTAYGDAVNSASKLSSKVSGEVILSSDANDVYPTSPNGKVSMSLLAPSGGAVVAKFPPGLMD